MQPCCSCSYETFSEEEIKTSLFNGECLDKYKGLVSDGLFDASLFNNNKDILNLYQQIHKFVKFQYDLELIVLSLCLSYNINFPDMPDLYVLFTYLDLSDPMHNIMYLINENNCMLTIKNFNIRGGMAGSNIKWFQMLCRHAFKLNIDLTQLLSNDKFNALLDENSSLDDGLTNLALSKIEDLNTRLPGYTTVIMNCIGCQEELFQELLNRGADLSLDIGWGDDILTYHCFATNDLEKVKYISKFRNSMTVSKCIERRCQPRPSILEILHVISSMENFEDFMRLNDGNLHLTEEESNFVKQYIS